MSSRIALFKRTLILGLTLPGLALAGSPGNSSPMRLGTPAIPPLGYLQFCHQRPDECAGAAVGTDDADALRVQTDLAQAEPRASTATEITAELAPVKLSWSPSANPLFSLQLDTLRLDWRRTVTFQLEPWSLGQAPTVTAPSPALTAAVTRVDLTTAMSTLQDRRAKGEVTARGRTRLVGDGLQLTKANWKQIGAINEQINRSVTQRSDLDIYGTEERWALPLEDGLLAGDCEDFALEKRHALIAAGFPRAALNLAVAITPQGVAHTVLIVSSDRGDYVLDSLTPWILPWAKTGYQWRQRQVRGEAMRWAMVEGANSSPARLTLASLR